MDPHATNSVLTEPGDPGWIIWEERLSDFHGKAPIGHYRQHVAVSAAQEDSGNPVYVISYRGSGDIVASSMVIRRRIGTTNYYRLFIDRGPCLAEVAFLASPLAALKYHLRGLGVWLRLNPYFCGDAVIDAHKILRQSGFKRTRSSSGDYQATVSVDLATSDDVLWGQLKSSVRRQIRRSERLGVTVIRDKSGELAASFFDKCYEAAEDKGFGLPGGRRAADAYHAMRRTSAKPALFISQHDGRQVAGIALMPAGNRVIYEWGFSGSEPGDRKMPLSHRLHWKAMCWARKSGFLFYDMGGFWVNRGDQDPINRFKLGFSSEIQPVLGEYFFPLSPILGRLTEAAIRTRRWNVTGGLHA